jgi:5'/3'-nucleotidase
MRILVTNDFEGLKPAVRRVLELLLRCDELELVNVNLPEQYPGGVL